MKNTRGFIVPLLLAIIGLLLVGGGVYIYSQQTKTLNPDINSIATTTTQTQTSTNPTTPSATIDQSSLTTTSANPTITGTARGLTSVVVEVGLLTHGTGGGPYPSWSISVPVKNGTWSFTPSRSNEEVGSLTELPVGLYGVSIWTPDNDGKHPLVTSTLTISDSSKSVPVPGMSKYIDADFGFSFWYPSTWSVTTSSNSATNSYPNGSYDGIISIRSNTTPLQLLTIQKVTSQDLSYKVQAGACGTCDPKTYYFDTVKHLWMLAVTGGGEYAPSSGGQPADISINTMGGLHMFYGQYKQLNKIVPLSAKKFLSITDMKGWAGAPGEDAQLLSFVKTIVATDPSVATPVSQAEQTITIQTEASILNN